jgi:hypothetical protein
MGAISRRHVDDNKGVKAEEVTEPADTAATTKGKPLLALDVEDESSDEDDENKLFCVCKEPYDGRYACTSLAIVAI